MEISIPKNSEYRIDVLEAQKIRIMVTAGLVEIFGQELLNEKWYNFTNIKLALFTFTGARFKIEGNCDLQYLASVCTFRKIFNYFDMQKDTSKTIIVLGKGRTTFCTTMINYFVKLHKKVDFIELDPSKGNIFPGTLSYLQVDTIVDYSEKMKLNNPFCLFYGSLTVDNDELFEVQTNRLVKELEDKNTSNFKIILSPDLPFELLSSVITKFNVSEAVVIGNERHFHRLKVSIPKVFIENTGYVSENTVASSINRYFNGPNGEYTPTSFMVKHDWSIFRIGAQFTAPDSALPLGASRKIGKTDVCKCDLMQSSVLGISEAEKEEDIATSPMAGFIVCLDEEKFRVLCVQPKLPKLKYLVQGNVKYIDY